LCDVTDPDKVSGLLHPFMATDTGGRKKAIRTSKTVIVLLDGGSCTGVRGGTRQELPLR